MGSYISMGFVYKNNKKAFILELLKGLLLIFISRQSESILCKYSLDIDGDNYIQKEISINDLDDEIVNNYYGQIFFKSSFLGFSNNLILTIYKELNFFGFLIDLNENEIRSLLYLELENKLINHIKDNSLKLNFDYAFCENEGEIEYHPLEVEFGYVEYSVLFINKEGNIIIKKADYLLDGITKRN